MKLALISLSKDTPDDWGPIGLLPLFDGLLVDQQIQSVRRIGVEKIILISPTMKSEVLQYADMLQSRGVDIEIVRSGHDLIQFAAPENEIIFVGDGILPGADLLNTLIKSSDELILVTPESAQVAHFERIDRNARWLGIAKLDATRLSGFIDLPEDWDVGSALLRGAVQSECLRETIEEPDLLNSSISNLTNEVDVLDYSQRHLRDGKKRSGNFLQKFIGWPLTRAILPRLWKMPNAYEFTGWFALFSGALASGLTLLNLPILIPIILLMISAASLYIRKNIRLFSGFSEHSNIPTMATYSAAIVTLILLIIQTSIPVSLSANLVIFILGLGLVRLVQANDKLSKWDWIKPDIGLLLTIILTGAIFGSFVTGIYASALLSMAYLLLKQLD